MSIATADDDNRRCAVCLYSARLNHDQRTLPTYPPPHLPTGPLFTESATEREMRAVDSEDSKNRINDFRRSVRGLRCGLRFG